MKGKKLFTKLGRLEVTFQLIDAKKINLKIGAQLEKYSYWHFTRLYKRYKESGIDSLFKQTRNIKPRKFKPEHVEKIKEYYTKFENPPLSILRDFLKEDFPNFPDISLEYLRKILIKEGIWNPGKRKKKFRKRFESPYPGALVQGDSCDERWIPEDDKIYYLIAFLDDNSRFCLDAELSPHDDLITHFRIHKRIIKKYGVYQNLYYDNDEKYSYIRHGNSRFFEYKKEKADLQMVRALEEVGINVINTKPFDPQARGKIERFWGTAQTQLPFWFQKYGVKTLQDANRVLKKWIKHYNNRIHSSIKTSPMEKFKEGKTLGGFRPLSKKINLKDVFCYK